MINSRLNLRNEISLNLEILMANIEYKIIYENKEFDRDILDELNSIKNDLNLNKFISEDILSYNIIDDLYIADEIKRNLDLLEIEEIKSNIFNLIENLNFHYYENIDINSIRDRLNELNIIHIYDLSEDIRL